LRRGFLAAREDLVKKLSELVASRHQKLFGVVNEILEQALRVYGFGKSLSEVVDEYEALMVGRKAGYVLVAQGLLYPLVEGAYLRQGNKLEKAWYEHGVWLGSYLSARFGAEDLEKLEKVMNVLLWEASEFKLTKNGDKVTLRCIGSTIPPSYTSLLASFLEGVMNAYGLTAVRKDVSRGVVILDLARQEGEALEGGQA